MKNNNYLLDGNVVARPPSRHSLFQRLRKPIGYIYHRFLYGVIYTLRWYRGDPHWINNVDPLAISHTVNIHDATLKKNSMWHFGLVSSGNWDEGGAPINEYGLIYPILEKVLRGEVLDETSEFLSNLQLIKNGESVDVCSTENEYRRKWGHIQKLYRLIEQHGYKSQKELRSGRPFNEIRIQIGREGNYLLEEGMHRLVIAQLLRLKKVPVIITRRHSRWWHENSG